MSRQEETLVAGQVAEPHGWEPSQIAALAVVSLAGLMASLTQSLLIPVLPSIAEDVGSSTTSTEWLLTSSVPPSWSAACACCLAAWPCWPCRRSRR